MNLPLRDSGGLKNNLMSTSPFFWFWFCLSPGASESTNRAMSPRALCRVHLQRGLDHWQLMRSSARPSYGRLFNRNPPPPANVVHPTNPGDRRLHWPPTSALRRFLESYWIRLEFFFLFLFIFTKCFIFYFFSKSLGKCLSDKMFSHLRW